MAAILNERDYGDLKPLRNEDPNEQPLDSGLLFFIALSERNADGDKKREDLSETRSPLACLPTENDHLARVVSL